MHLEYFAPDERELNPRLNGRVLLFKGSSSSSSVATTTVANTTDKRMVVDTGVGISSESSTVNVTTLDAGIVNKALDTIRQNDAGLGEGFTKLLGLAEMLFKDGSDLIESTQTASLAQLETINSAANDKTGAIDQKTIIVLGIAGAAALVLTKGKL